MQKKTDKHYMQKKKNGGRIETTQFNDQRKQCLSWVDSSLPACYWKLMRQKTKQNKKSCMCIITNNTQTFFFTSKEEPYGKKKDSIMKKEEEKKKACHLLLLQESSDASESWGSISGSETILPASVLMGCVWAHVSLPFLRDVRWVLGSPSLPTPAALIPLPVLMGN